MSILFMLLIVGLRLLLAITSTCLLADFLLISLVIAPSTATTYLPRYLRLDDDGGLWNATNFGDGMVIGIVDSGIWWESRSFNDRGLGAPKPSWRGICEKGNSNFTCNNKIIGARAPHCDYEPGSPHIPMAPTDFDLGHGTFVSAVAAGSPVENISFAGYAKGTATGVAPKARISMYDIFDVALYKIQCRANATSNPFEFAIEDGVDIISVSVTSANDREAGDFMDPDPLSAFKAERMGIPFVTSAGNDGPVPYTVRGTAPWMTCVGAGTMDRHFPASLILGNGKVVMGQSMYGGPPNFTTRAPLVKVEACDNNYTTFSPSIVNGKFLACLSCRMFNDSLLQTSGGLGALCMGYIDVVPPVQLFTTIPVFTMGQSSAFEVQSYLNTSKEPFATLNITIGLTRYGGVPAPMVPLWTSRGPGVISPEIVKPDIIAPGLRILSAYPPTLPPCYSPYILDSGTSISCPVIAGISAMVKKKYPKWSPDMIRSALMTTSTITDNRGDPIMMTDGSLATPFDMGAGHVNPSKVLSPGLVYQTMTQDYIDFMCTLNFSRENIEAHLGRGPYKCNKFKNGITDLNYPSIGVVFNTNRRSVVVPRTLTKVSHGPETYKVRILNHFPEKFKIDVAPDTISFQAEGDKAHFQVSITSLHMKETTSAPRTKSWDGKFFPLYSDKTFAHMIWESNAHVVTSPIGLLWEVLPHPSNN